MVIDIEDRCAREEIDIVCIHGTEESQISTIDHDDEIVARSCIEHAHALRCELPLLWDDDDVHFLILNRVLETIDLHATGEIERDDELLLGIDLRLQSLVIREEAQ